jgi:ankyrin repeat protein
MQSYQGINVDPLTEYQCIPCEKSKGFSILHYLTIKTRVNPEYLNLIKNLVAEHPEELNKKNAKGYTALMLAAANCSFDSTLETVKLLIELGAQLDIQRCGSTALILAARYAGQSSSHKAVQLLIDYGATVDIQTARQYTALHLSVRYANTTSNMRTVYILLNAGADVNKSVDVGWTPFHFAVGYAGTTSCIQAV